MKNTISVILTIHNKSFLIERVLAGILYNISSDTKEMIAVFDGCNDDSEMLFDLAVKNMKPSIQIIKKYTPDVWEVKANNIGLKSSQCDFSCIVQDDMVIEEKYFDQRIKKPLIAFSDCFAATGRTAHNNKIDENDRLYYSDLIGRENPGGHSGYKKRIMTFMGIAPRGRNIFGIRDVVNRGPLIIDNERLKKLGYLDEAFSPLGFDDHDLCFRAFKEFGWLCGSYPIRYESDLSWGGTRANEKAIRISQESHEKNKRILISRHRDLLLAKKHNENRKLN